MDIDGSFELVGVSEVLGEPELIANHFDLDTVDIEDFHIDKFMRNFNTPLTDLNDPVIVQARPFDSHVLGVPMGRIMSIAGESFFFFHLSHFS